VALSPDELRLMRSLDQRLSSTHWSDALSNSYYEGEQALETLGLAVPPELQRFTTVVNWPAMVVDTVAERIKLKGFVRPGEDEIDDVLAEGWDANNMDSDQHLLWNDMLVYGRGFVTVGTNENDPEHPLISVESPREMAVEVDTRTRKVLGALKLYSSEQPLDPQMRAMSTTLDPDLATLYLPDSTVWMALIEGKWVEMDRDDHNLGTVPVTPVLNRRRTGRWFGASEMTRAISLTDAAARALTNLQIAQETHAVPQRYILGASKGDFVDQDGNPLPVWSAYFSGIWASGNKDASVGQFSASDLRNFTETVNFYGAKIAGIYGLPPQYVGNSSSNPASAEAIREAKEGLLMRAEAKMDSSGDALGRTMALYERFRTGSFPDGNRIKTLWFDAATPTLAARADAVMKLNGNQAVLSREGSWDEMDWSEARKARERQHFAEQASDPLLEGLTGALAGGGAAVGGS
jgi:hypothetical protein